MRMEKIEAEERKIKKDRREIIYLMKATEKDGRKWVQELGRIPRSWDEAREKTFAIWGKGGGGRRRAGLGNKKPNPKKRRTTGYMSKERIHKQSMALPKGKPS
jgi:hypothetical protein